MESPVTKSSVFEKACVFAGRCLFLFLFLGALKVNGVLIEDFVKRENSSYVFIGWVVTLQPCLGNMAALFSSLILKKLSYRQVGMIGGLLSGLGYIGNSIITGSSFMTIICCSVSGLGMGFLMITNYFCLKDHFGKDFGTFQAMSYICGSFGICVLPVYLEYLRGKYGLSGALLIFGAVLLNNIVAGCLLLTPKFIMHRIDSDATKTTCKNEDEKLETFELEKKYLLEKHEGESSSADKPYKWWKKTVFAHHKILLVHCIACFIHIASLNVWEIYMVPFAISRGFEPSKAVLLLSFDGIGTFVGCVIGTALFYRGVLNSPLSFAFPFCIQGLFIWLLISSSNVYLLEFSSFVIATTISIMNTISTGILLSLVCSLHFEVASLWMYTSFGLGASFGGLCGGFIRDVTGSYDYVFGILGGSNIIASLFCLCSIFIMRSSKS